MASNHSPAIPLYVHILMGIGALFGFLTIDSLLFLTGLLNGNSQMAFLIFGFLFIGLGLGLNFLCQRATLFMQSFYMQSALLFIITGKIFILIAAHMNFSNPWSVTATLGFLSLSTYFIFPNIIDRFLFLFSFLLSLTFNLDSYIETNLLLFVLFFLAVFSCLILYTRKTLLLGKTLYTPIEAALISYVCILTTFVSLHEIFIKKTQVIPDVAFNFTLGGMLIFFILYHAGSLQKIKKLPILFSCVGLLILSIISNAGILWGIALLVIGHQNSRRVLISLGAIFLIGFLVFYYYNLSLTLDYKSYLLIGNGIFLLLTRAVIQYLKWDQ